MAAMRIWIVVAWVQAAYFVLTGVWPLLHMKSFLAVTGPKTDLWLVKTVGALVIVVGVAVGIGAWRKQLDLSIVTVGMGTCLALAGIDVVYVAKRVISRVYLLDAVAEAILLATWGVAIAQLYWGR